MNRQQRRQAEREARKGRREEMPVSVVTVDDFVQSDDTTDTRTLCNYIFGVRGQLTQREAADNARELRRLFARLSPHTPVMLSMVGYDEDPRELHEIPEARRYLGWFATEFDKAGIDEARLVQISRDVLGLGRHIAAGHDVEIIISTSNVAERTAQDIANFQDTALKKLS